MSWKRAMYKTARPRRMKQTSKLQIVDFQRLMDGYFRLVLNKWKRRESGLMMVQSWLT